MERITVRLDERLKKDLEAEAQRSGVRPSEVVRLALDEHLKRRAPRESCLDIAMRTGLIGCIEGLPSDLSTNKKYMEGFGDD